MRAKHSLLCLSLTWIATCIGATIHADDFDRLEGKTLGRVAEVGEPLSSRTLNPTEAARLPRVLRGIRSALVIVRTDEGNLAPLILDFAYRKPVGADAPAAPIGIIERFAAYEPGSAGRRVAQGKGIQLFDGYALDLDTGQIVPEGFGADLQFHADRAGAPQIEFRPDAQVFVLRKPPFDAVTPNSTPSTGRVVAPADFAGHYRLHVGGMWTGDLELEVDADSMVKGRFRSDETGAVYAVNGQATSGAADLRIEFPRSEVELHAILFAQGKHAMAGTGVFLDKPIGFYAERSHDASAMASLASPLVLELAADGTIRTAGADLPDEALASRIHDAQGEHPNVAVSIHADSNTPYEIVAALLARLRDLKVVDIRLRPIAEGTPDDNK